jgi:hypothetical protein
MLASDSHATLMAGFPGRAGEIQELLDRERRRFERLGVLPLNELGLRRSGSQLLMSKQARRDRLMAAQRNRLRMERLASGAARDVIIDRASPASEAPRSACSYADAPECGRAGP